MQDILAEAAVQKEVMLRRPPAKVHEPGII